MARPNRYIFFLLVIVLSLLTTRCALEGAPAQLSETNPDKPAEPPTEPRQTDSTNLMAEESQDHSTQPTTQTTSITGTVSTLINPEAPPTPVTPSGSSEISPSSGEPGQVPGGAGQYEEPTEGDEIVDDEPEEIDLATWLAYTDDVYHYTVSYPPYYEIKHLDATELARLSPSPIEATLFKDQRNELADIAPPDFSIQVFENTTGQPLEDWLVTTRLLRRDAGWFSEPWKGEYESGIKVVSPTLMAPGWFVYVTDNTYVFRLTPLGTEGELMLDSFALQR